MRPRLESVYFGGREYHSMAKVLELSAQEHIPHWDINIQRINNHELKAALSSKYVRKELFPNNAHKALAWCDIVQKAKEGDCILLIDSDTMILKPLDEIWSLDFDYARTVRDFKWPWNSGVMFLRVNERTKRFFELITEETFKMLNDATYHEQYEERFGGIHQAAIGAIIERNEVDLKIIDIPCKVWNSEHTSRNEEDFEQAKIVHFLPSGRKIINSSRWMKDGYWRKVGRVWFEYKSKIQHFYRWGEILNRLDILYAENGQNTLQIAEIGVWQGHTVKEIKDSPLIGKYYLIDPWKSAIPGTEWYNSGSKLAGYPQGTFDAALKKVANLVKNDKDRVKIIRKTSEESVDNFEEKSLDLVFIDGDHSKSGVLQDISLWYPKIKDGGYIGGHDFDEPRFPGVREAVEEKFDRAKIELGDDYTWFYRKPKSLFSRMKVN